MKNLLFCLLLLAAVSASGNLLGQDCPYTYSKSPLQAGIYNISTGTLVDDVVSPGQIYYLKIKPVSAVLSQYPTKHAVNIGVQISGYTSSTAGFTLYSGTDTSASLPFSDSVVQSGVGPDVGADQTAVFVIKINSDNYDGQISFNGGYYMCVDHLDSNNLPVYAVMPVKLLIAP